MGLVSHESNEVSEKVIAAAIEVHRHLGPGLLESSYHACLCHELTTRRIVFCSKVVVPLEYKGMEWPQAYVADVVVERRLVLEIKAVDSLKPVHANQLITYMRLLHIPAGILINFNVQILVKGGIRRKLL